MSKEAAENILEKIAKESHEIMDSEREKDIQELCKQVIEMSPTYYPTSSRGGSDYSCPFCYEETGDSMDTIQHKGNCAYLIAKDLSTNL